MKYQVNIVITADTAAYTEPLPSSPTCQVLVTNPETEQAQVCGKPTWLALPVGYSVNGIESLNFSIAHCQEHWRAFEEYEYRQFAIASGIGMGDGR